MAPDRAIIKLDTVLAVDLSEDLLNLSIFKGGANAVELSGELALAVGANLGGVADIFTRAGRWLKKQKPRPKKFIMREASVKILRAAPEWTRADPLKPLCLNEVRVKILDDLSALIEGRVVYCRVMKIWLDGQGVEEKARPTGERLKCEYVYGMANSRCAEFILNFEKAAKIPFGGLANNQEVVTY